MDTDTAVLSVAKSTTTTTYNVEMYNVWWNVLYMYRPVHRHMLVSTVKILYTPLYK